MISNVLKEEDLQSLLVFKYKIASSITQEELTGPLRPLNFCRTLQLHYTVSFSLIDVK